MPQTKLNRCVFSSVEIGDLHSGRARMVVFQFVTFFMVLNFRTIRFEWASSAAHIDSISKNYEHPFSFL